MYNVALLSNLHMCTVGHKYIKSSDHKGQIPRFKTSYENVQQTSWRCHHLKNKSVYSWSSLHQNLINYERKPQENKSVLGFDIVFQAMVLESLGKDVGLGWQGDALKS